MKNKKIILTSLIFLFIISIGIVSASTNISQAEISSDTQNTELISTDTNINCSEISNQNTNINDNNNINYNNNENNINEI